MQTPTTSKTAEHLRIGDQVVRYDGTVRTVHAIYHRSITNERNVHYTDGTAVVLPSGQWVTIIRPEPVGDEIFDL